MIWSPVLHRLWRRILFEFIQIPNIAARNINYKSKTSNRLIRQVKNKRQSGIDWLINILGYIGICYLFEKYNQEQTDDGSQNLANISSFLSQLQRNVLSPKSSLLMTDFRFVKSPRVWYSTQIWSRVWIIWICALCFFVVKLFMIFKIFSLFVLQSLKKLIHFLSSWVRH